jgi:hypothetical protein
MFSRLGRSGECFDIVVVEDGRRAVNLSRR